MRASRWGDVHGRGTMLLAAALPAAVCGVVYPAVLSNGFACDDPRILEIARSLEPIDWSLLLRPRGLTYAFHVFDLRSWGEHPYGFHLTNLVLHALASSMACVLGARIAGSLVAGLLCGLLFAVHPVHVEVVAGFANRGDALGLIFASISLLLWLSRRRPVLGYVGALVFAALCVSAKETVGASFVPMLLIADLLIRAEPGERTWPLVRRALLRFAPFLALLVGAIVAYAGSIPEKYGAEHVYQVSDGLTVDYRDVIGASAAAIPERARLLFYPMTLSFDYPLLAPSEVGAADRWLGVALLAAWLGAALWLIPRSRAASFSMLWVVVTYLPYANIVPITVFPVCERYLYMASFGVCLLFGIAAGRILLAARRSPGRGPAVVTLALIVCLLAGAGIRSAIRCQDWLDDTTLGNAALSAGIDSWRIRELLGRSAWNQRDYRGALTHYDRAVELNPRLPRLRYEHAALLVVAGRPNAAVAEVRAAGELAPPGRAEVPGLYAIGAAFLDAGKPQLAARLFMRVLRIEPRHPGALEGIEEAARRAPARTSE